jgi:hypothetical protein
MHFDLLQARPERDACIATTLTSSTPPVSTCHGRTPHTLRLLTTRNGTAERSLLTMIGQVRAALLQSGLSSRRWSCAAAPSAFVLNHIMKKDKGQSAFVLRFPDASPVTLAPFGALVRVRLPREQARALLAPFASVLQDAILLS